MPRNLIDFSQNHMATTFTLKVSCEKPRTRAAESVLSEAHCLISQIENEVSEYRSTSDLSRLNQASVGVEYRPDTQSLLDLLRISFRIFSETRGAFDPSFRSRTNGSFTNRFEYDADRNVIRKIQNSAHLSFGAIGKGYALDRVRTLLEREGFIDYLLSAGGSSIIVSGKLSETKAWPLAWSWEKQNEDYYGKEIKYSPRRGAFAIGVSGTLEKGEHIERSTLSRALLSSWISGPSAAEADGYSTALFSEGWEKSQNWFRTIPSSYASAGIYQDDKTLVWNGEFQNRFGSLDQRVEEKEMT